MLHWFEELFFQNALSINPKINVAMSMPSSDIMFWKNNCSYICVYKSVYIKYKINTWSSCCVCRFSESNERFRPGACPTCVHSEHRAAHYPGVELQNQQPDSLWRSIHSCHRLSALHPYTVCIRDICKCIYMYVKSSLPKTQSLNLPLAFSGLALHTFRKRALHLFIY